MISDENGDSNSFGTEALQFGRILVQKCYSLRQFWYRSAIVWDSSGTEVLQFGIVLVQKRYILG